VVQFGSFRCFVCYTVVGQFDPLRQAIAEGSPIPTVRDKSYFRKQKSARVSDVHRRQIFARTLKPPILFIPRVVAWQIRQIGVLETEASFRISWKHDF
jgi:hypothetical protein